MTRTRLTLIVRSVIACVVAFVSNDVACAQDLTREVRLADFDALVGKLEQNYAGWETKVTPETLAAFGAVVAKQRTLAGEATSDEAFFLAARGLLKFFADGHLTIRLTSLVESSPNVAPTLDWTEASVKTRLDVAAAKLEPLEGIWETIGGRYRLGVLRNDSGAFAAAVLATQADNWSVGMVKAEFQPVDNGALTGVWRMGDHSVTNVVGEFVSDGLFVINAAGGTYLQRVYPPASALDIYAVARRTPWPEVFFVKVTDRTAWLRLPSFNDSILPRLASIMEEHKTELETVENLIIDLRSNSGGSDYVYALLTPLICSRPVYSVGVQIKCSEDNIAGWEALLTNPEIPAEQIEEIRKKIHSMRSNLGGYFTPEPSMAIDVCPEVKPFPKRVALLIQGAGSSGEQFILEAMQSRKVTMFGKGPSAGVLDFANVRTFPLPSGRFEVGNPTSRSLRLPNFSVDPNGIAPDVMIREDVEDEIEFVQKWLEQ